MQDYKTLRRKHSVSLYDLRLGNGLLDIILNAQATKGKKVNKLDCFKI